MSLPNFLIIGAAKSGTTALYHYLKQHPQIYMSPQKETNFFAFKGQKVRFDGPGDEAVSETSITTADAYKQQFEAATDELAIGEASPYYLYSAGAASNIARCIPDAKLIAILRNPVDRAFSSYLHVVRHGRETLSFEGGLRAEEERVTRGWEIVWHYQRAGLYAEQIERYLDLFGNERIRFYLYDDLVRDSSSLLRDIYDFLAVDTAFEADTTLKPNVSGVPRNQLVQRLLFQPNPIKSVARLLTPQPLRYNLSQSLGRRALVKPILDESTRASLREKFAENISTVRDLTGLDLSAWTGPGGKRARNRNRA